MTYLVIKNRKFHYLVDNSLLDGQLYGMHLLRSRYLECDKLTSGILNDHGFGSQRWSVDVDNSTDDCSKWNSMALLVGVVDQ